MFLLNTCTLKFFNLILHQFYIHLFHNTKIENNKILRSLRSLLVGRYLIHYTGTGYSYCIFLSYLFSLALSSITYHFLMT